MSGNGLVVLAAVGVAGFVIYKKMSGAAAPTRPTTGTAAALPTRNVMGDMWSRILGGAWTQALGAAKATGGQAFVMRDQFGRVVTSDGKPVGSGDPLSDWMGVNLGLPSLIDANNRQSDFTMSAPYDSVQDLTTGEWTTNGGASPLDQYQAGITAGGGGVDFTAAQPFSWYGTRLQ